MTATLATLRKSRRVSQLELSLRAGVSQRHLSCIETGRARAGRETLIALLDALGASLEERNQALLAAGYAPAHAERALDAPEMAPVRAALEQLIHANGAAPALVLDGEYNVVMGNAGLARLLALLGLPGEAMLAQPLNLLRAVFAPGGLRSLCVDEAWLCNEMWARASREAEHLPRLRKLLDELRPTLQPWTAGEPAGNLPVLAFRLRAADGRTLSFFSTVTSFGTPLDITLASLKVEHLFPTDDVTREALAAAMQ
ncbi:helix-turn-helix domain-containing protein [Roseateles asaccharophilus]|uniref:Transcriptional regulator with XRE-family HTH domain n=1 Tax=Roseateles asaccharophilus TaxID=582607 RepID=A0ABU2AEP7_9BURK|nr:helix-turn-helix domain-containing protein [Roseateles asaccharophilus]MDR7335694.1 transcriptional regulator with XRE-family HTH domain [Roseateles asaccharophilus]